MEGCRQERLRGPRQNREHDGCLGVYVGFGDVKVPVHATEKQGSLFESFGVLFVLM